MEVSIGKTAKELGVHADTLQRWEKQGKTVAEGALTRFCGYALAVLHALPPDKEPSAPTTPAPWYESNPSLLPRLDDYRISSQSWTCTRRACGSSSAGPVRTMLAGWWRRVRIAFALRFGVGFGAV